MMPDSNDGVGIQINATEHAMQTEVILILESVDEILKCDHTTRNYLSSTFLRCCLLCGTRDSSFESDHCRVWMKSLKCDHSNESY